MFSGYRNLVHGLPLVKDLKTCLRMTDLKKSCTLIIRAEKYKYSFKKSVGFLEYAEVMLEVFWL